MIDRVIYFLIIYNRMPSGRVSPPRSTAAAFTFSGPWSNSEGVLQIEHQFRFRSTVRLLLTSRKISVCINSSSELIGRGILRTPLHMIL